MASTGATLERRHEAERVEALMEVQVLAAEGLEWCRRVRLQSRSGQQAIAAGRNDYAGTLFAHIDWEMDAVERRLLSAQADAGRALGGKP